MIDDFFANQMIMGPLRTLLPALMAYLIGAHMLPAWFPVSEFDAFLLAGLAALWSRNVHKQAAGGGSSGGGGTVPVPPSLPS